MVRGTGPIRRRPVRREPAWTRLDDEALLDKRFCDLRLTLEGTWVEAAVRRLYGELAAKGIRFRPHVWLSEEWFSPDGIPGIAIPFYLVHPRLARLERRYMLEAEGGNDKWLMRILRHETGHAIDTAFALRRRKAWRRVFGKASRRYPSRYSPRPTSRRYVLHLGHWYAQSHPHRGAAPACPPARRRRPGQRAARLDRIQRHRPRPPRPRPRPLARTVADDPRPLSRRRPLAPRPPARAAVALPGVPY